MYIQTLTQAFTLPRTYLTAAGFVALSVAVPQFMHQFSLAGTIFLPILFFTFFATVRYGTAIGLLTALASPLASSLLTGMPPGAVLYVVSVQCLTIALLGGYLKHKAGSLNLLLIAGVIVAYQVAGGLSSLLLVSDLPTTWIAIKTALPGMLIQLLFFTAYSRYLAGRK